MAIVAQMFVYIAIVMIQRKVYLTLLNDSSFFDKKIASQRRLNQTIYYISIVLIFSILGMVSYINGTGGYDSPNFKTMLVVQSELSIFVILIAGTTFKSLNFIMKNGIRKLNSVLFYYSIVLTVSYIAYPFVALLAKPNYQGSAIAGDIIQSAYIITLLLFFFYLLYLNWQFGKLADKVSVTRTFMKVDKKEDKMNKYQLKKLNNKNWKIPNIFEQSKLNEYLHSEKLSEMILIKLSEEQTKKE